MASNVTLSELRQAIRDQGEFREAPFPDAKLTRYINRSLKELYGRLVRLDPSRYHSTATYSVAAGAASVAISSQASDFYQAIGVEIDDASADSGYTSLRRYQYDERNDYTQGVDRLSTRYEIRGGSIYFLPKMVAASTIRLRYIPTVTALSADGDTFDGVNGWDQYIVWDVCVRGALEEESDHRGFLQERQRAEAHIFGNAVVDRDKPRQVTDVRRRYSRRWRRGRWD